MIKTTSVKRLFWDLETSPNIGLFWRAGYDQHITPESIISERKVITVAYKWQGSKETKCLTWDKNQDDRKMLVKFAEVAEEADELVAHFGDRFDLPWFKTRCLIHGLPPLPAYKTVDTKAWASKYFYFNSNKLDYIGQVLNEGKKIHTDFDLWKDIVLNKCPIALHKMVKYNIKDVVLLEKVYEKLKFCVKPKTHAGVAAGLDAWTDPMTGSKNVKKSKTKISASGTITHQFQCLDTGGYYTINDSAFKKYQEFLKNKHEHKTKAKGR